MPTAATAIRMPGVVRHEAERREFACYLWAFAGLALAILPHVTRFSPAIIGCFFLLGSWRLLAFMRVVPMSGQGQRLLSFVKVVLALAAFLTVWVSYRGQPGRDAGIALLALLAGLKLLEMNSPRDFYMTNALGYFLVVTNFLYSQSMLTALYLFAVVTVLVAGLIAHNGGHRCRDPRWCLGRGAGVMAQALPVAIAMFLFFPRVEGPLWGRPNSSTGTTSGLTNEMSPGSISELRISDEIAFRVDFDGAIPPARERYWRGPVLWHTDGQTWRARRGENAVMPAIEFRGVPYRYTMTLEPHDKRWLLALDMPADPDPADTQPAGIRTADLQFVSRTPVRRRISYDMTSYTDYRVTTLSQADRSSALALPQRRHPRTRDLADRWRREYADDRALVDQALRYINEEPFEYTLTPPLLGQDRVDDFLFSARAGYCEHYAASFVTLMRAAGIPARVVTGYQGGEYNTIGDYVVVRQRDAHAWSEVWIAEVGWMRVDPTAAVDPSRVSLPLREAFTVRTGLPLLDDSVPVAAEFWRSLFDTWDAANHQWNQWVLGYNPVRQRQFLRSMRLGELNVGMLGTLMTIVVASLLALLALWSQLRLRAQADPVAVAYRRFCRKLQRAGLTRGSNEGPLEFADRVARERRDLRLHVSRITREYVQLRYGQARRGPGMLQRLVRAFQA